MAELKWETLEGACHQCRKCRLWEMRTNVVVGDGCKTADIMFIGEGPGAQEDLQGLPFVGPAGQLLDKMLASVGFNRKNVYIANIVKCRPPGNRDPHEDEQTACMNYLRYQLLLVKPKIIVCLGRIAAMAIIDKNFKITREHGTWVQRKGYYMTAIYHPSALLRDEQKKRPAWEDLKEIRQKYEELQAKEKEAVNGNRNTEDNQAGIVTDDAADAVHTDIANEPSQQSDILPTPPEMAESKNEQQTTDEAAEQ